MLLPGINRHNVHICFIINYKTVLKSGLLFQYSFKNKMYAHTKCLHFKLDSIFYLGFILLIGLFLLWHHVFFPCWMNIVCFKLIVKFQWKWQSAALLRSGFSHLKWLQKVYGVIIVEVRWRQKHNGPISDRTWHWLSCYHSGHSTDKNIDAMAKNSQRRLVLPISSSLSWWGCFQMWIEGRKKMHVEYVGNIFFNSPLVNILMRWCTFQIPT